MDGSAPDISLSNVVATAATKLPDKLLPLGIFFGLLVKKKQKKNTLSSAFTRESVF